MGQGVGIFGRDKPTGPGTFGENFRLTACFGGDGGEATTKVFEDFVRGGEVLIFAIGNFQCQSDVMACAVTGKIVVGNGVVDNDAVAD